MNMTVRRIVKNAVMLAMLCVVGMFSIPLGANIKVSLQLLMVYIICLTAESFVDGLIVTSLYLGIGMLLPVYAGFSANISPTFGYVIGFVIISPIIYFINKTPIKNDIIRMSLACVAGLLVCYVCGTLFMMFYLSWDILTTLAVSVVPYIPFDVAKIVIAILIIFNLNKGHVFDKKEEKSCDRSQLFY